MTMNDPKPKQLSSRRRFLWGVAAAGALVGSLAAVYRALRGQTRVAAPVTGGRSLPLAQAQVPMTHRPAGIVPTGMALPRTIGLDAAGRLYIGGDRSIRVLDISAAAEQAPTMLCSLPAEPTCLAIHADGTLYVGVDGHVEVRDGRGTLLATWERPSARSVLTSIAIADHGIYVADAAEPCVYRYDRAGQLIGRIGARAASQSGDEGLVVPSPFFDVAIDGEGAVWVANPGRHRVECYSADGALRSSWGKFGHTIDRFCGCCNPSYLTLWPGREARGDAFLTSEKGVPRVKLLDREGCVVGLVAGPEHFEPRSRGLDVVATPNGVVWVLDPPAKVLRRFEPTEQLAQVLGSRSA